MSGINSYTHDPVSMMSRFQEPVTVKCEFCSVEVPEELIEEIDGYHLCEDCYNEYANEQDPEP